MHLRRWLMPVQWILLTLLGLSLFGPRSEQLAWARLPGLLLSGLGLLLVVYPIATYLAVNRSIIRVVPEPDPSATMVRTGAYRFVRHPVYLGAITASLGLALFAGSLLSLALTLAIGVFYYVKSLYEEELLIVSFPGYAEYRKRTGRFLPRLSAITRGFR